MSVERLLTGAEAEGHDRLLRVGCGSTPGAVGCPASATQRLVTKYGHSAPPACGVEEGWGG